MNKPALPLRIRPDTAADALAIDALILAAFLHAPHTEHTETFIVQALRAAGQLTLSLVAEHDGIVIGHVAVSPLLISDHSTGWYGLGPLAVAPARQHQGIGSQLVQHALDGLRQRQASGCVVLGEPAYYSRFGFRAEAGLVLPGVPAEYFQAIAFQGQVPRGTAAYHAAFAARGPAG